MSDRTLTWQLGPVGARQLPVDYARVEMRVDESFEWTHVKPDVPAGEEQKLELVDVNPGRAIYRLTIYDTAGGKNLNPPVIEMNGAYDPPSDPTNFTAVDT